jgi:hypothetical protein
MTWASKGGGPAAWVSRRRGGGEMYGGEEGPDVHEVEEEEVQRLTHGPH